MYKTDISFLDAMNIKGDAIVINQTNKIGVSNFKRGNSKVKFISTTDRGLSKSRNMAIKNASGDICVVCDDDLRYYDNCIEDIRNAYKKNPEADIIIFCYHAKGRQMKKFYNKPKRLNYIDTMRVTSFQITFKRNSIVKKGILFNEFFGTGSSFYQAGEENIFLFECLRKGLKIYFEPIYILEVIDDSESSWFNGYNAKYMFDRGAIFTAMSKTFSLILILQFLIRKYKKYKDSIKVYVALKHMLDGRKDYLRLLEKQRHLTRCEMK